MKLLKENWPKMGFAVTSKLAKEDWRDLVQYFVHTSSLPPPLDIILSHENPIGILTSPQISLKIGADVSSKMQADFVQVRKQEGELLQASGKPRETTADTFLPSYFPPPLSE